VERLGITKIGARIHRRI